MAEVRRAIKILLWAVFEVIVILAVMHWLTSTLYSYGIEIAKEFNVIAFLVLFLASLDAISAALRDHPFALILRIASKIVWFTIFAYIFNFGVIDQSLEFEGMAIHVKIDVTPIFVLIALFILALIVVDVIKFVESNLEPRSESV